jgi:hypothetical protein
VSVERDNNVGRSKRELQSGSQDEKNEDCFSGTLSASTIVGKAEKTLVANNQSI